MSVQALAWVFKHERTTSGAERHVLLVLANYADERWECWPGVKRIQAEANLGSETTVHDAISRLIAKGLVERVVQGAPDGRTRADRRPNLYRLHRIPADVDDLGDNHDGVPIPGPREAPRGTNPPGDGVPPIGTQTVIEPSNPFPSTPDELSTDPGEQVVGEGETRSGDNPDEIRRAVLLVCAVSPPFTDTECRALAKTVSELVGVGATAEQIRNRSSRFREMWPEARLTPAALVRHWSTLAPPAPKTTTVRVRCDVCEQPVRPHMEGCSLDPAPADCPALWVREIVHGA